jgi:hypothetical protein
VGGAGYNTAAWARNIEEHAPDARKHTRGGREMRQAGNEMIMIN